MTADQMFIIAVLTLIIPVVSSVVVIAGGVIAFNHQNKKIDATHDVAVQAAVASGKAELAANHSKEVVSAMQENFKAVVAIIAPDIAMSVPATLPAPSNRAVAEMTATADTPPTPVGTVDTTDSLQVAANSGAAAKKT